MHPDPGGAGERSLYPRRRVNLGGWSADGGAGAEEDVQMQLLALLSSYMRPRSVPNLHVWCLSLLHRYLSSWLAPPPVLPHPTPLALLWFLLPDIPETQTEIPQTRAINGRDRSLRQSGKEITRLPSRGSASLISTTPPPRPLAAIPPITSDDDWKTSSAPRRNLSFHSRSSVTLAGAEPGVLHPSCPCVTSGQDMSMRGGGGGVVVVVGV